jgi:hypothetical protein
MAKHLIVTEFQAEAEFYFYNRFDLLTDDTKILSLLPESAIFWKKNGMASDTSVPYFPKSSHERCLEVVDKMVRRIDSLPSVEDDSGIRHAYANALTFYLRMYLSYVVLTIETIENFIERNPAGELHVCAYNGNDCSGYGLSAKERILGEVLRKRQGGLKIETHSLNVPDDVKPNALQRRLRSLFCLAFFEAELKRIKPGQDSIAFYSLKFNFDRVARHFKNFKPYNLAPDRKTFTKMVDRSLGFDANQVHFSDFGKPDAVFEKSWARMATAIRDAHYREKIFSYRGIDFSEVIFRKMEDGYAPESRRLNRQAASIKRFLKALKPRVVVSPMAREVSYALGEMCSLLGIPSALISHGSHVPPQNPYERMEWLDHGKGLIRTDYQYHLLQSPWAVEHVRAMGYQGNYYRIEPLIFPTVDRKGKEEQQLKMYPDTQGKKIIVHAGTPKPRGSNRLYIYETLDEYIEYAKNIVEETRGMSDVFVVIRFRPYPQLSVPQLKALLPPGDHYSVASEGSFADYLKIADLMVSFSSTTIEEALINRIPVLQYDGSNRYAHIDGTRWTDKGFAHVDSVYYIGDRASLRPGLEWIVRNHLKATTIGDLFERHTFQPDEAVRVEEFIERLLKNDLPEPVHLKEKAQLNLGEIYDR